MTAIDEQTTLEVQARRSASLAALAAGLHVATQWNQMGLTWSTNSGGWTGWVREDVVDDEGSAKACLWWVEAPNGAEIAYGFADSVDDAQAAAEAVLADSPRPATGVRAAMIDELATNNPHLSGLDIVRITRQALSVEVRRA